MGPPQHLSVDQGSAYVSDKMKRILIARYITMVESPIETPGTIGIVERYHSPLRSAYHRIHMDIAHEERSKEYLAFAVHAAN